jgi:hypothetical protein
MFLEERRQVATYDAAEIGEQHRHPGVEGALGRFSQKTWQCDTPELPVAHDLPGGHLFGIAGLVLRFLPLQNIGALFTAEFFLVFRVFIKNQPTDGTDQAQYPDDDERQFPTVGDDGLHH